MPDVTVSDVILDTYIGGGAQGAVYAGRVAATGQVVAVKVIRTGYNHLAGDPAVREAQTAAKVRHPNILRIYEARRTGEFWLVLMEYLRGDDLESRPPPPGEVASLLDALADAVRALAAAGIVHRDIKPENVVRRAGTGEPVLVDFGLATDLSEPPPPNGRAWAGTPKFMAPEAFSAGEPHPVWDAYSLGLTALVLAAPEWAAPSGSLLDTVALKLDGTFDRIARAGLEGIADRALAARCARLIGDPVGRMAALDPVPPAALKSAGWLSRFFRWRRS